MKVDNLQVNHHSLARSDRQLQPNLLLTDSTHVCGIQHMHDQVSLWGKRPSLQDTLPYSRLQLGQRTAEVSGCIALDVWIDA